MFRACVKTSIFCECNSGLIVAIQNGQVREWLEDFFNKAVEPDALLYSMRGCDIFCFGRRQGDEFLLLQHPANSSSIQDICIARDHMVMLLAGTMRRPKGKEPKNQLHK